MAEPENDTLSSPSTPDDEPIEEGVISEPESEGKSFWARALPSGRCWLQGHLGSSLDRGR